MAQQPTSRELVNEGLNGQLFRYLQAKRHAKVPVRVIVDDIYQTTDVLVTERTVWRWIYDLGIETPHVKNGAPT